MTKTKNSVIDFFPPLLELIGSLVSLKLAASLW